MSTEIPVPPLPAGVPPPEAPWPPPWARKVAFFFGLGMMAWEMTLDALAHAWLFGPAFVLTGLPLARGVEKIVDALMALRGK